MRRTEALVSSMEQSVGMTKSARARFSASGSWWPRICRNFSGGHAGPGERAHALDLGIGRDHGDLVDLRPRRPSRTAAGCRAPPPARPHARRGTPRAPAPPPDGPEPRAAAALRARPAPARPARCDSRPPAPVVPGKCASISATSAPSGPCSRCTAASASNTGTPSSANIRATVDLPMPIEPVRPRTIMTSATLAQLGIVLARRRPCRRRCAKAKRRLVDQHRQARRPSAARARRACRSKGVSQRIDRPCRTRSVVRITADRSIGQRGLPAMPRLVALTIRWRMR